MIYVTFVIYLSAMSSDTTVATGKMGFAFKSIHSLAINKSLAWDSLYSFTSNKN